MMKDQDMDNVIFVFFGFVWFDLIWFFDQSCLVGSTLGLRRLQSPVPGHPLTAEHNLSLMEWASN